MFNDKFNDKNVKIMKLTAQNFLEEYPKIDKSLISDVINAYPTAYEDFEFYNDDDGIKEALDLFIDKVNAYLEKNAPKEPQKTAKFKVGDYVADLDDIDIVGKVISSKWDAGQNMFSYKLENVEDGKIYGRFESILILVEKPKHTKEEPKPAEKKPAKAKKEKKPKAKYKVGAKVVTDHSEDIYVVKEKNFSNGQWLYILDNISGQWEEHLLSPAPKGRRKKAVVEDTAERVKQISVEVDLFKSYANLNGKSATYRQLLSLHTKLGKAIISGAVDSPKYQDLLVYMHESIGNAMKHCEKNGSLLINVENVDRYREIGASEKLFVGVTLLKSYIGLANKIGQNAEDREKQRKNLLNTITKKLNENKVEKQYIDYVKTCKKNLEDKSIAPISLALSGLAGIYGLAGVIAGEIINGCCGGRCNGLGEIVSATELAKLDFDTIRIPQEYSKMIGKASRNGSIMLYGMAGGGKTSFSINLAKKCAEMGQKVLIVSKEEGINQTMQEKLRRFNAVSPNIFVTENIPASTKDYDVIIFDSVQSLQLEPADLEKHQHNLNALRVYVFQVTKDGKFRGANEFEHLVDCVLKAENGVITSSGCKNRFGGNGSVRVF